MICIQINVLFFFSHTSPLKELQIPPLTASRPDVDPLVPIKDGSLKRQRCSERVVGCLWNDEKTIEKT